MRCIVTGLLACLLAATGARAQEWVAVDGDEDVILLVDQSSAKGDRNAVQFSTLAVMRESGPNDDGINFDYLVSSGVFDCQRVVYRFTRSSYFTLGRADAVASHGHPDGWETVEADTFASSAGELVCGLSEGETIKMAPEGLTRAFRANWPG